MKHIINKIIETSIIPIQFKTSLVTPIHKTGPKDKCTNYRSISVINTLTKLFEKTLNTRLQSLLRKTKYYRVKNMAQKKSNTEKAILNLTNQIMQNFYSNTKSFAIFVDLQKAFDLVDHNILLEKLEAYGVQGIALTLMRKCITDRRQSVKINTEISNSEKT